MKPVFPAAVFGFSAVVFSSLVIATHAVAAEESVKSPDGRLELKIMTKDGALHYSVLMGGKEVITPTPVAIEITGVPALDKPEFKKVERHEVKETIPMVVPTIASHIAVDANEMSVTLGNGLGLDARACNDMVAFRWTCDKQGAFDVVNETFGYRFAADFGMFYPIPNGEKFISHQENTFVRKKISETKGLETAPVPFLADLGGGQYLLGTDVNVSGYPGLYIQGTGEAALEARFPKFPLELAYQDKGNQTIPRRADYIARTSGPRAFPWRAMVITTASGLLNSGSLYSLADKPKIADTSWIKPGKVAWDWWNDWNISDVDFKPGVNQATYKHYIDHAAENGLSYVVLDEGWSRPEVLLDVVPEIDMPALAAYAKQKGVGLILWMTSYSLEKSFDAAFRKFDEWGVKGLKIDFMVRDDQQMMDFCERVAETAAKHKLLVDFHGGSKPTGLQRTWPNVMEHESVLGLEQNKWSDKANPERTVLLPFIRMAVGPMDYTPGAMINRQKNVFKPDNHSPASLGTRCQQLALYVTFLAPLEMLADSPSNYRKNPTAMEFLRDVPTTWDETRVLKAEVGETVAIARRKGDSWWIGALTNWSPRTLDLKLDFLGSGKFHMKSWEDGPDAAKEATDNVIKETLVGRDSTYTIQMAPGGGFAAVLKKAE